MTDTASANGNGAGTAWHKISEAGFALLGALLLSGALSLHTASPFNFKTFGGTVIISLASIIFGQFHLRHTNLNGIRPVIAGRIILFTSLLAIIGVQMLRQSVGTTTLQGTGFLMVAPMLSLAMLTSALLGPTIGLFALTVVSLLLGSVEALTIQTLAASWIGGAVACHAVNPIKQRSDLLRAISITSVTQAIIAVGVDAPVESQWLPVIQSMGWSIAAAVGAGSVFWLSVAVFERLFGLTSDWSLLELCSPEHPLMRDLVLRAPGTYAHSVMVGNLSENAAREIGANPTLARAMAYFHDIGKLHRPSYFIENQQGENPHDQLPSRVSARIIISHIPDGLEMARKHRLPSAIIDGIAEHHGTSLTAYFYQRALEEEQPDNPGQLERAFRYPGPKPHTKESAILHLADSIEAMSRIIPAGRTEEMEIAVTNLIEERRADGQLDEANITFAELQAIKHSFLRTLGALRHERIAYGDELTHDPEAAQDIDLQQLRPKL